MQPAVTPVTPLLDRIEEVGPLWQISVEDYHAMIEAGILTSDLPVELIDGYLIRKFRKSPQHCYSTHEVYAEFRRLNIDGWFVSSHHPITLSRSEPEPDGALIRETPRDYRDRQPGPSDVAIIIEVADTSLERDQGVKKRMYARDGVREYWIINLRESQVEVYTEPNGYDYRQSATYGRGQMIPVTLDGRPVGEIAVDALLGPPDD